MDIHDLIWNPWHGCHKCSEGCQNCYAFFLDKRYGRDTNEVVRNKSGFNLPVKKSRDGSYKMPDGAFVRVCMASDFFWKKPTFGGKRHGTLFVKDQTLHFLF